MQFSLACQPTQVDDVTWVVDATTEWRQGRTTYGGLVAAWLANAMAPLAPEEQQMRTLSVTFAGPIAPGAAEIKTEVDRRGKSTTFTSATITSEEGIATRASAVFTRPRAASIGVEPRVPKLARSMAQAEPLPELEGLIPTFMEHFELRFGIGSLPFVGADEPLVGGYCRHREAALGVGALAGLIDAWPPAILAMANGVIPSSSVTWNIHFLDPDVHVGTDWFEFRYEALAAKDGYSTCAGTLSKDGRAVAMTEQMTAYFG
jgi:acyl-CoA thioesterase